MYYDDFIKTHTPVLPYALMDLDDTLFQTKRKLADTTDAKIIASTNKKGEPLSYFTTKQATFFAWLFSHTTLIPVTARDIDEIKRVKLPFNHIKVLTHGAVILDKDNQRFTQWEMAVFEQLYHHQNRLHYLYDALQKLPDSIIITPHTDSFMDCDLMIYLAIKHTAKNHDKLAKLAQKLPDLLDDFYDDFYIHVNANNLAILPHFIHKKHAVNFLKHHYFKDDIPLFGFGDSLADLPFLALLDWYGTPNKGQLHGLLMEHFYG